MLPRQECISVQGESVYVLHHVSQAVTRKGISEETQLVFHVHGSKSKNSTVWMENIPNQYCISTEHGTWEDGFWKSNIKSGIGQTILCHLCTHCTLHKRFLNLFHMDPLSHENLVCRPSIQVYKITIHIKHLLLTHKEISVKTVLWQKSHFTIY